MNRNDLFRSAITGLLAMGAIATVSAASADEQKEQCAGVIKAGKNDCATNTNACHGHVEKDNSADAWIYLPAGTCERISGARVVKVVDPTPKAKQATSALVRSNPKFG